MRLPPLLGLFFSLFLPSAALYSAVARWGQAIAVIDDALFVYGGKTDPYNTYGYDSAPWNNDILSLSLSSPFDPSAPPWQYVAGSQNTSTSQGTALAWHTLSPFNSTFSLIFGGSTGPLSSIVLPDNDDSAQLLNTLYQTAPTFLPLPNNWAGEPQRRMRHASASANGVTYIIGGEAADGSGNTFSTHYIFNPSVPTFTQLPTENSPPGIFGHSVVILSDGRLLVFGGISAGQLVPLSTVWVLDTTLSNLAWTLASIDGSILPSSRAAFAVVLLDDGRILIQGGTDASFQTNLADGWILDPSTNPMTWIAVPALSQVGARRDHFAISANGQVVFAFGYGDSAPADPAVQVYNVPSSSFQPTFSPTTTSPAHTTLLPNPSQTTLPPDPSQTITNPPGSSQTRASANPSSRSDPAQSGPSASHTVSKTGDPPFSTGTGGGQGAPPGSKAAGSRKHKVAITIGSVLGGLGFITGVALVVWYLRRHARSGHAFDPLGDNDDEESPHEITAIRLGGTRKGPWILAVPLALLGMIGLGPRRRHMDHSRRDILADEDRSFQWVSVSREGSGGRSSFGSQSARNSIRGLSSAITERFRNFARGSGSAPRSQEPSSNWEKMIVDPFSPEVALMAEGLARNELPERSGNGFARSGPSQPYTDPFSDRDTSSEVLRLYDMEPWAVPDHAPESRESAPIVKKPAPLLTTLPPSTDFVPMSPLVEQASQNSLSNSSSSHHTSSDPAGSGSSNGAARSPRPSSILDLSPPTSQPIRRTNSWWMRFAKTPLLERRGSSGFIDIRDPNPPPRLLTIEETTLSRGASNGTAGATQSRRKPSTGANRAYAGTLSRKPSLYHEIHGRSASSLQTANTEMLERVGGTMDIVQRDGTLDSHHTPITGPDDEFGSAAGGGGGSGSGSYTQQLRALIVRGEPSYHSTRTASSSVSASIDSPMIQTPFRSAAGSPTGEVAHPSSSSSPPPSEEAAAGVCVEHGGSSPRSPGVAERVRAFERRLSLESAAPPSPTNTRRREERLTPPPAAVAVARPAVRYGLVPRPSLFVANPDGVGGSRI